MTSQTREISHDQHHHPTRGFYIKIGVALLLLTVLEILGYLGETENMYGGGVAAAIILVLSAIKFLLVVALYMHLKYDHKLFTGIFVFPALLGTLVIGSMIILFQIVHGTSTEIHGTPTDNTAVHGSSATTPTSTPRH